MKNTPLKIAGVTINPGEKSILELPAASLYTQTSIYIPVHVIHGKKKGPCIFIFAAVHGDEINGIEIIRRLLRHPSLKNLCGTVIAVPVANVHGFITLSRYLPDRRDLNRAFPGSKKGSLAARMANLYMEEIISRCQFGIDLHTGNIHSENLPHIRTNLTMESSLKIAKAFGVPVVLNAKLRDGSIREAATQLNIPVLVYEGGEALRFNEMVIRIGLRGVLNVMRYLKMIKITTRHKSVKPHISFSSSWIRSPQSGIFYASRQLGTDVENGEKIGFIADPFTKNETEIFTTSPGIIVGKNTLPLVNEGDALFNIAKIKGKEEVTSEINDLQHYFTEHPLDYL